MNAPDCIELRARIQEAKKARNDALVANATADDAGQPRPHTSADIDALRLAVDIAALEARSAGCDVNDISASNVGRL